MAHYTVTMHLAPMEGVDKPESGKRVWRTDGWNLIQLPDNTVIEHGYDYKVLDNKAKEMNRKL